ncbi:MAG: hypothetical protein M0Q94_08760 [Candidatus Cloacimonetes bacterium]|jgi:hypothetical protein|nr:hypothetical protein [Candidatus Cloacimonadota bacterium]
MKEKRKPTTIRDYLEATERNGLINIDGTRVNSFSVLSHLLEDTGFWELPEVKQTLKNRDPNGPKIGDVMKAHCWKFFYEEYGNDF